MSTKNTKKDTKELSPIKARILELITNGLIVSKIKATLILEDFKNSEIDKAIKEAGLVTARSSGFTYPDTLAYLSESPRTEKEFYEKILDEGTRNEARWINDRNKIRVTYNAIFVRFNESFKEELASPDLKKEVKERCSHE